MRIEEVMSTDVVAVDGDATLREAAAAMTEVRVGSVLVRGEHLGILTETDAVRAGAVLDRPFSEIRATEVATGDPVTVAPEDSLGRAVETGVKRLPVRDGIDLVGMVTVTDVARHVPERVSGVRRAARKRREWTV